MRQLFSRCPGAFKPSTANVVPEVMHESRILEGSCVSSKNLSFVCDGDDRVAGRNAKEKHFPDKGSLICPSGKLMIFFYKKETKLVARPGPV